MRRFLGICIFLFVLLNSGLSAAACSSDELVFSDLVAKKSVTITGPFSVDALERENMIEIRETKKKLPFGYGNEQWLKFKAAVSPEDKIYFMVRREGHFYQDGHILVHDGCVIQFLQVK